MKTSLFPKFICKISTHLPVGILLLTFSFFYTETGAQYSAWENYTNGNTIEGICGKDSLVWVGTTGGLVKINSMTGNRTYYNKANSALPVNEISNIVLDTIGNPWMICKNFGIAKFDGSTWSIYTPSNSPLPSQYVFCIKVDRNNKAWIGTGNGLAVYDGTAWINYNTGNSSLPSNNIFSIDFDAFGNVWVGTLNGLVQFDGTNWTVFTTTNSGLSNDYIFHVKVSDTIKWIVTQNALNKFDGLTWSIYDTVNSTLPSIGINDIQIDTSGNIWLGTNSGLVFYNDTLFTLYDTANTNLTSKNTNVIYINQFNTFWVGLRPTWSPSGSSGGGVYRYDGNTYLKYNTSNSTLPGNMTNTVIKDNLGNIWAATENGLAMYDGTTWINLTSLNNMLPDKNVQSIAIDISGNMWLGTYSGLMKYDGTNVSQYTTGNSSIPSNSVVVVTVENGTIIWVGTFQRGMASFDGTTWTTYEKDNSQLPCDSVRVIEIDPLGNKWIGTEGGGLIKIDLLANWTIYKTSNSGILGDNITGITFDSLNRKWISTYNWGGGGINLFNDTTWVVWNDNNSSMPTYDIKTINLDKFGNLLVSSGGCSFYCALPIGLIVFDKVLSWAIHDVFNSAITNNDVLKTVLDNNGDIWIATAEGVSVFKDPSITSAQYTPAIESVFKIFPNPTNGKIQIHSSKNLSEIISIELINLLGEVIQEINLNLNSGNSGSFDISSKSQGTYLLRIQTKTGLIIEKIFLF